MEKIYTQELPTDIQINIKKLQSLYMQRSKHSNYQSLPKKLNHYIKQLTIKTNPRYDHSRLDFIIDSLPIYQKTLLDVGGNTGFFTIELLESGIRHATFYEGNRAHTEFVSIATNILGFNNKITIINSYLDTITSVPEDHFDITILMNVLHHIGDDFGNRSINIEGARNYITQSLKNMAYITEFMVLQIGYNWKGDINLPLFTYGTKQEQIDFIEDNIQGFWNIIKIGIPEIYDNNCVYKEPTQNNMIRRDDLGEFLNRPLFILKSII